MMAMTPTTGFTGKMCFTYFLQNCHWINMDKQACDKYQRGMKHKVGMNVEGSAIEDKNKKW